jgi:hypothetical protein
MTKLFCKKRNKECAFWSEEDQKCVSLDGDCFPIIEQCEGCDKIYEFEGVYYCKVYTNPKRKWEMIPCYFKKQKEREIEIEKKKDLLNPIKMSKRRRRGVL